MAAVRLIAASVVALLVAVAVNCAAAPFAVQLGDTRIGVDAPPGFADASPTGSPRLMELGEALTSASNRILLFAISDADLRRFTVGDLPELRRYMIIVTPRAMERDRVTTKQFDGLVDESLRSLGQPVNEPDFFKWLGSKEVGTAYLLQELRKDHDVVSVLQGTRVKGGLFEKNQLLLTTTTLMVVRGKALNLAVYSAYDSPADLEWIRLTTARWIEELRRLNGR
jgi:hypothetical protein